MSSYVKARATDYALRDKRTNISLLRENFLLTLTLLGCLIDCLMLMQVKVPATFVITFPMMDEQSAPRSGTILQYAIRGIEDIRSPAWGTNFNVTQLGHGFGEGKITHARLGESVFSFGELRTNTSVLLMGEIPPETVYFNTGLGQSERDVFWGKEAAFGDIGVVLAATREQRYQSLHRPRLMKWASMALPAEFYTVIAEKLAPGLVNLPPQFMIQPSPSAKLAATRALCSVIKALNMKEIASALDYPGLAIRALGAYLDTLEEDSVGRALKAYGKHVVVRLEELVRSRDLALSVPEICLQLQQPRRAVERLFRSQLNTSPAQYLLAYRLCRAREDLIFLGESVTNVAVKYGFYEFGRFAGRYKRFFGETPSETLLRQATLRKTEAVDFIRASIR